MEAGLQCTSLKKILAVHTMTDHVSYVIHSNVVFRNDSLLVNLYLDHFICRAEKKKVSCHNNNSSCWGKKLAKGNSILHTRQPRCSHTDRSVAGFFFALYFLRIHNSLQIDNCLVRGNDPHLYFKVMFIDEFINAS